jgi:hypothetical protein
MNYDLRVPKIAMCFFGITRSLSHTISSIEHNVIGPACELGEVSIYSHFFLQRNLINPRSQEQGQLNLEEHRLLPSDWLQLEEPDIFLAGYEFEKLMSWGDSWQDDFRSLRNLLHQLHSLSVVTTVALANCADIVLFCRPDLSYHDNLSHPLKRAMLASEPTVFLPYWQPCGGLNDRFAICVGKEAIAAYGHRIRLAQDFCATTFEPLHSELLLSYGLSQAGVSIRRIGSRASRVRLDGTQKYEDFSRPWVSRLKARVRPKAIQAAEIMGLRQKVRSLLKNARP